MKNRLMGVHQEFIKYVKERRMGSVFGATNGLKMGLVDGIYKGIEVELTGDSKF